MVVLAVIVGFLLGASAAWLLARSRAQVEVARLETALGHEQETAQLWKSQFEQYRDSAAQELRRRHESFEQLVRPIKESLERVDGQVKTLEQSRREDRGALTAQLSALSQTTG